MDTGVNFITTAVWQAIASPTGQAALPTLSSIHAESVDPVFDGAGRSFEAGRSLWNVVLQMSVTSLGWPSPALGFLRWREEGYPASDPRLELLSYLLGNDLDRHTGHLLRFLFGPDCWGPMLTALDGDERKRVLNAARPSWLDRYETREDRPTFLSPLTGGTDPLHLQVHVPIVGIPNLQVPAHGLTDQIDVQLSDGRAVLVFDDYANWYGKLTRFGASLKPRPDGRSWRVDIVVKPVGSLGTYRLSRLTGRWFSGPHSLHEWGVPK